MERNDNLDSESDIDESDSDSDADSIYGMEFGETPEQWCESEAELCNLNQTSALACNLISTSAPLVDIPI